MQGVLERLRRRNDNYVARRSEDTTKQTRIFNSLQIARQNFVWINYATTSDQKNLLPPSIDGEPSLMPGAGIEPAWVFESPTDFKSVASANFATRARNFTSHFATSKTRPAICFVNCNAQRSVIRIDLLKNEFRRPSAEDCLNFSISYSH